MAGLRRVVTPSVSVYAGSLVRREGIINPYFLVTSEHMSRKKKRMLQEFVVVVVVVAFLKII